MWGGIRVDLRVLYRFGYISLLGVVLMRLHSRLLFCGETHLNPALHVRRSLPKVAGFLTDRSEPWNLNAGQDTNQQLAGLNILDETLPASVPVYTLLFHTCISSRS